MFKIISKKEYEKNVQALESAEKMNVEYAEIVGKLTVQSSEEILEITNRLKSDYERLNQSFTDYRENAEKRIENCRLREDEKRRRFKAKNDRIEELETELKIVKGKSNTLTEQSLKDKETIQNLKNDNQVLMQEISAKSNKIADLEDKIKAVKSAPVPAVPTDQLPNTLKEVELAPLEAEVVPAPKPNNVKRPYQKTGKFKKRK